MLEVNDCVTSAETRFSRACNAIFPLYVRFVSLASFFRRVIRSSVMFK